MYIVQVMQVCLNMVIKHSRAAPQSTSWGSGEEKRRRGGSDIDILSGVPSLHADAVYSCVVSVLKHRVLGPRRYCLADCVDFYGLFDSICIPKSLSKSL